LDEGTVSFPEGWNWKWTEVIIFAEQLSALQGKRYPCNFEKCAKGSP